MAAAASFDKLKSFLESRKASATAMRHMKKGVEIGIVIGHQLECAYFQQDGKPVLEKRPANSPDVIFHIKPESVDILCSLTTDDVGELGVAVLKEYLSGGVRIKAPGSIWNITMNGYLGIIKEGGVTFTKFLATHGLSNITKIVSVIKDLKKSS